MKWNEYKERKSVNFSSQSNFGIATKSATGAVKGAAKGAVAGATLGATVGAGKAMVSQLGVLGREFKRGRTYGVGAATRMLGKMYEGSKKGAKTGAGLGAVAGVAYGATKGAIAGAGKGLGRLAKSGAKEIGGLKKLGDDVTNDFKKAAGYNSSGTQMVNPELYYIVVHVKDGVELVTKKGFGDREDAKLVLERKSVGSRSEFSILKGSTIAQKYAKHFKLDYNA